jgi:branched-chain amino acid transport system permease protein
LRCLFRIVPITLIVFVVACGIGMQDTAVDQVQRDICERIVPVVEPDGAAITLLGAEPDRRRASIIRIRYRSSQTLSSAAPNGIETSIACAFAGTGFASGKATLIGVETAAGRLSDVQLLMLNRFWLRDASATSEALARMARGSDTRKKGFIEVDAGFGYFLQQIVNAGVPSALYALLAVAFSLVYGLTNRINVAFGDIATIGAYSSLIGVAAAITAGFPAWGIALPAAILVSVVVTAAWSRTIGRLVFLPLLGRSSQPLLVATIGLSVATQEFIGRTQGVRDRWLPSVLGDPHVLASGGFEVVITTLQTAVIGTAILLSVAVVVVMRTSRFGRAWRAVADDSTMSRLLGIDPARVLSVTFALAGALAACTGAIVLMYYGGVSFSLGTMIGLKALVAAIIGGIGSLPGALLGGILIGFTETFWSAYEASIWRDVVILSLLVVFLTLQPNGLLGNRAALEEGSERP